MGAVLRASVAEFDLGAHAGEQLALGLDVAYLGDVFEDDLILGKDGGGHAGEGGVLCSGDFDGAKTGIAATYNKLVLSASLRGFGVEIGVWEGTGPREMRSEGTPLAFACGFLDFEL